MIDQEIVPLRVVLRNFLNHIENLESQSCPEESYEAEFLDLKLFSENVKTLKEFSCLEGEKEVNRKKNRYKDILPFDISRVVLSEYAGVAGSDYINANFIKGASGSLAYIASQGPLPSTVNDFWRMVVECEVQVIVMACNEEEAGKSKCEKYWVDEGEEKQFGMITVKLLKSSTVCSDFSIRTMRLKYPSADSVVEERTVCQLHYVAWPDHGVPTVVGPLLDMVRLVRDTQASETLPVLVHCSAGCGRTGTICAIDYVWGLLRTGKLTCDFSLLGLIRDMRKQRIAMVQTKEQYVLVHQAVRELFKEQLSMIDSHPYENVDTNGLLIIKYEENTYDSIDFSPNNRQDEKNDNKEKDSAPPPLPSKRNINKFPSKYEKEIENLSAQQRSLKSNVRHLVPICSSQDKPEVPRKEFYNGFEIPSKRPTEKAPRSKSDHNKPIPSKGILSVPQLETAPRCKPCVKRSKSLKVVRNCEKGSLSFTTESDPPESERRSSLESNFDVHVIDNNVNDRLLPKSDLNVISESKNKSVSQLVSKYDILRNQDHRTFVRSLTCTDFRPKLSYSSSNSVMSSLEESLAKQRVKLLRSNTQINVVKRGSPHSQGKNDGYPSSIVDKMKSLKVNSPQSDYSFVNSPKASPSSFDKIKLGHSSVRGSSSVKPPSLFKTADERDVLLKSSERIKNPVYQKFEGLRIFKETPKLKNSGPGKAEPIKRLSYEEAFENYSADRNLKLGTKPENSNPAYGKIPHSKSFADVLDPSSHDSSKFSSKSNQFNFLKSPRKSQVEKSVVPPPQSFESFSQEPRTVKRSLKDPPMNSRREEYLAMTEDYPVQGDLKSSPSFGGEPRPHEPGASSWMERDCPGSQALPSKPVYSSSFLPSRPNGHPHLYSTPVSDDSKEILRKLDDKSHYEPLKNPNINVYADPNLLKGSGPPKHSASLYHLQNKKNIHQYNGSVYSARLQPPPPASHDIPSPAVNRTPSKPRNPMNNPHRIDAPSGSQDVSFYSSGAHQVSFGHDFFQSAPGVDLDQVAASFTKNDENLMKATLEELQVRKTKSLISPKDRISPKSVFNPPSSADKKKQQQYL